MAKATEASSAFLVSCKWLFAALVSFWITVPLAVQTLVGLMVIDYATGLLVAMLARKVSSAEGLRGLVKKVLTILLVLTAHLLVRATNLSWDFSMTIAGAFAANEVISITENCADAGVPIPPAFLDVLLRAKKLTGRGKAASDVRRDLEGE
jgi:toxin secretion/phage lysis holin